MAQAYYLIGYSILGITVLVFLLYRIGCFIIRLKAVMKVFVEIRNDYERKGCTYWEELYYQFRKISVYHE